MPDDLKINSFDDLKAALNEACTMAEPRLTRRIT